jgi:hypothetical protein
MKRFLCISAIAHSFILALLCSFLPAQTISVIDGYDGTSWRFGSYLSFDNDFDDLVVGAPREAPGADPESGAVFVFFGSEGSPIVFK